MHGIYFCPTKQAELAAHNERERMSEKKNKKEWERGVEREKRPSGLFTILFYNDPPKGWGRSEVHSKVVCVKSTLTE